MEEYFELAVCVWMRMSEKLLDAGLYLSQQLKVIACQVTDGFEGCVFEYDQISCVSSGVNVATEHKRRFVQVNSFHGVGCLGSDFTTDEVINPLFVWFLAFEVYVFLHNT